MVKTSLDRSKIRVLLLEGVHSSAVDVFKAHGYSNIEYIKTALPDEQLKEKIAQCHIIGIRSRTQLSAEILAEAHKLMTIGCFCIGTNHLSLQVVIHLAKPHLAAVDA